MTRHAAPSARPAPPDHDSRTIGHRTWLHRSLVTSVVALTLALTTWTGAHAFAVERVLDANRQVEPQYHSVRQLERAEADRSEELRRLDEIENRRLGNHANTTSGQAWRPSERHLLWLEHSELRRFRNRAPAWGHPALDAEIERLRAALADATP